METDKKYKLTDECITIGDKKLYRIESLKDFAFIKKGDKGGFVESEENLSQVGSCWIYNDTKVCGNAWVYGDAKVFGDAEIYDNVRVFGDAEIYDNVRVYGNAWVFGDVRVYGNAQVFKNARVYGNAKVSGNAMVYGNAWVFGNACVYGDAEIYDNVRVYGNAEVFGNVHIKGDADISSISDYIFFKNWWSSGRCFTWTRSNNMWSVGCFYGTGEELIAKAYKDSEISGKEYELVVKYVESILKDGNTTTIVNKIKQRLIKIIKKFNL